VVSAVQGFGADFVELDHQKSGNSLYLHLQWKRVRLGSPEDVPLEQHMWLPSLAGSFSFRMCRMQQPFCAQEAQAAPSMFSPTPVLQSTSNFVLLSALLYDLLYQVPLTEAEKAERAAAAANKPNKLALGTEGGFALENQKDYTLDKTASLVVLQGAGQPRLEVPLPCPDLPELVLTVITAIQV